jgi:hypothetical protein
VLTLKNISVTMETWEVEAEEFSGGGPLLEPASDVPRVDEPS